MIIHLILASKYLLDLAWSTFGAVPTQTTYFILCRIPDGFA